MLLRIHRDHADYMSFRPEKKPKEPVDQKDNTNPSPNSDASHSGKSQLEMIEVYKPTTHVNPVFVSVGADTSRYYTASEASDVVFRFVRIFIFLIFMLHLSTFLWLDCTLLPSIADVLLWPHQILKNALKFL